MEQFNEEYAKLLLSKEWMVKIDTSKATPYLLKFYSSSADLSCFVLMTDTKSVWTEVLNSKQLARRWRECNPTSPQPFNKSEDEDAWREETLELLSKAHTIGGIADFSFETVETKYSDIAFELECENFKWRWETCFLGYQRSSEIISKHLIFPLISVNHMTFSSKDAVSGLSDADIEKAVDKVGRTARRTIDTHIKNALSKPRLATTIRRMAATFNFISDLPPVTSSAEEPDLRIKQIQREEIFTPEKTIPVKRSISPKYTSERITQEREAGTATPNIQPESATESDDDQAMKNRGESRLASAGPSRQRDDSRKSRSLSPAPSVKPKSKAQVEPSSDAESSPHRPVKKVKKIVTSSESGSPERKPSPGAGGVKRGGGTRQPIKRGGKRF
ncbi:hypothetical protein B0H34DRAFT_164796 [Crassisporium funariophilum]|nr:hypothetical protein B0H34DRAFT_164796 [Crassisporium funariophilum]